MMEYIGWMSMHTCFTSMKFWRGDLPQPCSVSALLSIRAHRGRLITVIIVIQIYVFVMSAAGNPLH